MFKPMIAALIAATALVPPALAQDRGHRGDRGDRGPRADSNNGGGNSGGGWRQRGGNEASAPRANWRQSQPQPVQGPQQEQAPRAAPQPQQAPQQRCVGLA